MAQLLRQVVAAPRARHEDTGLDLCYVTENIIATSGPSQTYPRRAYRTPLAKLVKFLDEKHGDNWAIWEFRAEGTGYPDDAVYGRIHHFPWPDHHPPPFRLVPLIMGTMKNWLHGGDIKPAATSTTTAEWGKHAKPWPENTGESSNSLDEQGNSTIKPAENEEAPGNKPSSVRPGYRGQSKSGIEPKPERVVVVHCKAGKGRSGSMSVSYLISECGWAKADALQRFTERRMLPGFGAGISIPSQVRWIDYVERWAKHKRYIDRAVEVLEVHCWGLRNGVRVEVEGFVDEGRKIKVFHAFTKEERNVVEGKPPGGSGKIDMLKDMLSDGNEECGKKDETAARDSGSEGASDASTPKRSASKLLRKSKIAAKAISRLSMLPSTPNTTPVSTTPSGAGAETPNSTKSTSSSTSTESNKDKETPGGQAVLFKPSKPVILHTSDINISLERRSRAPASVRLSVTTAVAHVWFNAFFEGEGPERLAQNPPQGPLESGVFGIEWDALDGLKGARRKGVRALDRMEVVWRLVPKDRDAAAKSPEEVREPEVGEEVEEPGPADWRGEDVQDVDPEAGKRLGVLSDDEGKDEPGGAVRLMEISVDDETKVKGSGRNIEEAEGSIEIEDELKMVKSAGPKGEKI